MNTLTRLTPASDLSVLRREMDRLFDSAFSPRSKEETRSSVWMPRADLAETEDVFFLDLDLPGIDPDRIDITLEEDTLTISGERRFARDGQDGRIHRVERSYGRFFRTFRFSTPVDADRIEANVEHGVLSIQVPKAEASKPRRIAIRQHTASGDGSPVETKEIDMTATTTDE